MIDMLELHYGPSYEAFIIISMFSR